MADDHDRLCLELAEVLGLVCDVVVVTVVPPEGPPDGVVAAVRAAGVDALVVASVMAVPPAATVQVLHQLVELPVVVWAARRTGRLRRVYTHADIARDGATVGTPQLTSLLVRGGRSFDVVDAALDDTLASEQLGQAVVAAGAAGRIRRARIGRVGNPIEGYDCVDADEARLSTALGVELVDLTPGDFLRHYEAVSTSAVGDLTRAMTSDYALPTEIEDDLSAAVRAAVALGALVNEHGLDAGAFNCHGPEVRLGARIGFAPCFALGHCTSAGVPWTCTGDVLTAVAMLTARALTGASLYHELEAYDASTGEFVVANSGEHDTAVTDGPATVATNPWWQGWCASTPPRTGPATLVAFAQLDDSHRFIVAGGEVTGRRFDGTGTSNGAFRFTTVPATAAWTSWCRAGANHHSALTPHAVVEQVARVAAHLGQEIVRV